MLFFDRNIFQVNSQYLSSEQKAALDLMRQGHSIFLNGEPGTGKSVVVQAFRKENPYAVVLLAPSGVAAFNIGGQTIHSFFKLSPTMQDPDDLIELSPERKEAINAIRTFVIDEVNMLRSDVLQAVDRRLRECEKKDLHYGGKQMIFAGDFAQLPPVVADEEDKRYLQDRMNGVFAFEASSWIKKIKIFQLTENFRASDHYYLYALDLIRHGNPDGLKIFNQRTISKVGNPPQDVIVLTPTYRDAHKINQKKLKSIDAESTEIDSYQEGITIRYKPSLPKLRLKVGARVLLTANNYVPGHEYVIGDTGEVVGIDLNKERIIVSLDRDSREVKVVRKKWVNYDFLCDLKTGKIYKDEVGCFDQFPLKPGWAIPIHLAQGMTIPRLAVDLGDGCFCSGQLYVALSRGQSLSELWLYDDVKEEDLITDCKVQEFPCLPSTKPDQPWNIQKDLGLFKRLGKFLKKYFCTK